MRAWPNGSCVSCDRCEFDGAVFVSGGLASDVGMLGALHDALARKADRDGMSREVITHPDAIFAGAIGAAIWGGFRYKKLGQTTPSWRAAATAVPA